MLTAVGSSSASTLGAVAAVVGTLIALWALAGTTRGRSWVKRLFRGESLQAITSTFADQVAATQAAYTISESERHRLEQKVAAQDKEIADLRKQIEFLGDLVTGAHEIKALAEAEEHRHESVIDALTTLGVAIARLEGRPR